MTEEQPPAKPPEKQEPPAPPAPPPPTPPTPPPAASSGGGVGRDPKPEDMIAKATAAAIRLEEANTKMAELLEMQTALKVEETLSGTAEAGEPSKSVEEKQAAAARKYLEGTGMEAIAFPQDGKK